MFEHELESSMGWKAAWNIESQKIPYLRLFRLDCNCTRCTLGSILIISSFLFIRTSCHFLILCSIFWKKPIDFYHNEKNELLFSIVCINQHVLHTHPRSKNDDDWTLRQRSRRFKVISHSHYKTVPAGLLYVLLPTTWTLSFFWNRLDFSDGCFLERKKENTAKIVNIGPWIIQARGNTEAQS